MSSRTIVVALLILSGTIIIYFLTSMWIDGFRIWGHGAILIDKTGEVGDFIGGVIGTIINAAAFYFLFLTLQEQRTTTNDQRIFFERERFEQRLFELIKFHRENVSEFEIAGVVKGRHCFKYMINELRFVYRIVEVGAIGRQLSNDDSKVKSRRDFLNMAYLIMFFGIGYSSERQLLEIFNEDEKSIFNDYVKTFLENVQTEFTTKSSINDSTYFATRVPIGGVPDGFTFETRFYPFDGHSSRLGHYFRLLFQIVKYIDNQPETIISKNEKYDYAKNLRATLSNQEQLLFYYNSLSTLGSDWIDPKNNLIEKYALIKNIPLGIVDIGVHPHDIFGIKNGDGKYLFETDEILARKNSR